MSDTTNIVNTSPFASNSKNGQSAFLSSFGLSNPVFWYSGGFIALFVCTALYDNALLSKLVNTGFAWSVAVFGPYWQLLLLLTFVIALGLAAGRTGQVKLGNLDKPETDSFRWVAMIFCSLLAGCGVFWAAAEPVAHYIHPAPVFNATHSDQQLAVNALSQSFMHWGFLAWSIVGSLTAIVLMHLHYDKGLPLKPRTLLFPILGERALNGHIGSLTDACCIIAVAAGTIGPIGFLGLQISAELHTLFQLPNGFTTQLVIILCSITFYTLSALSGLNRGMQVLSRYNIILALSLMAYILIFGPTNFIINGYIQGMVSMLDHFIAMATYRDNQPWLNQWTLFFWGWFLGYGPMMAIFIARILRGRTIRQLVVAISIVAPLATCFWFSIVGGTGLALEIANPGSVSHVLEGANIQGALLAITQQLPLPTVISVLFLVLTAIFIVTTGDSMTYTISVVISGSTEPNPMLRVFWGIMMGATTLVLITLGSGGISALQSFIVITAVPVSLILLPSLWNAPKAAMAMAKAQNIR